MKIALPGERFSIIRALRYIRGVEYSHFCTRQILNDDALTVGACATASYRILSPVLSLSYNSLYISICICIHPCIRYETIRIEAVSAHPQPHHTLYGWKFISRHPDRILNLQKGLEPAWTDPWLSCALFFKSSYSLRPQHVCVYNVGLGLGK